MTEMKKKTQSKTKHYITIIIHNVMGVGKKCLPPHHLVFFLIKKNLKAISVLLGI